MSDDFGWLATAPKHDLSISSGEIAAVIMNALAQLRSSSARHGVSLPVAFTKFMESRSLQERIRSNTDCYLDLCPELVRSPVGDGYLVRFLADSQGCLFWYLYLTSDSSDHAVVASVGFYGSEEEEWDEPPDPNDIEFAAESFETFMCRFWLENEIWLAGYDKTPMPDIGRDYIDAYRAK